VGIDSSIWLAGATVFVPSSDHSNTAKKSRRRLALPRRRQTLLRKLQSAVIFGKRHFLTFDFVLREIGKQK
jgi:hypothetical protein